MKLIKSIKNVLAEPLTIVINQLINTGIFPDLLKIAKISPIYKKGDETVFINYRPISLLPSISKIFEKVIFTQTYYFFQKEKFFYHSQYWFRNEHSTEFAAMEIIDRIMAEMDKKWNPNKYISWFI